MPRFCSEVWKLEGKPFWTEEHSAGGLAMHLRGMIASSGIKSNSYWLQQGPKFNLLFRETAQKDRLRQSWLWLRLPEGAWINNLMLFCFIFLPIKWHNNISPTHSLSYLFRLQDFWGRKKSPDEIKIKILCSFSASRSKRSMSLGIAVPVCLSRFGAELRHTSRQRCLLFMKIND